MRGRFTGGARLSVAGKKRERVRRRVGLEKRNGPVGWRFGPAERERKREREKGNWAVWAEKEIGKKKGFFYFLK